MRLINEWFVKRKEYLTFIIAIVLSTGLIFSNHSLQIQTLKAWTLDSFGVLLDKLAIFIRLNTLYEENASLRHKNAELMLENSYLKEARLENERLKKLLDFKSTSRLDLVPAKVIGVGNNGFINSIIISAGAVDSLKRNMAVVTAQGLVGKIYNVGKYHSTAQLILDRNFRVSAMIQRSRVTGIIRWLKGNQVTLAGIPRRADVKVGDIVTTSGYSSIFPAGIIIGQVTQCTENEQDMFLTILVQPVVDISKLEEVFVIKTQQLQAS